MTDPASEYRARLAQRQSARDLLQQRFIQLGNARLIVGICLVALAFAVFGPRLIPLWVLLVPVALFVALFMWHLRVVRERELRDRAVLFYRSGLDRLDDKWMSTGATGDGFRTKDHVYADDLDVFGDGSLFQLLSRARTIMGERRLASWLLTPASPDEARLRQESVRELADKLDLREDMFLFGTDVRGQMDPDRLNEWAITPPERFPSFLCFVCFLLAVAGVAALILFFAGTVPLSVLAVVFACDALMIYSLRQRVERTFEGLVRASTDLEILSLLLARLERENFTCVHCRRIAEALKVEGKPASKRIAQLARIMSWVASLDHALVRVFRGLLLWKQQCAFAVDRWRITNGEHVVKWIDAVAEFEALSSFASIHYERPNWCFPALTEDGTGLFSAKRIQHPLISPARCISNDISLGGERRLLIISGSNMSGKSTLLRSIGLNTVLAWAGAPVAAEELTISPLQPGASIRIADSLQDNRSRFFAEITRLKQILELSDTRVLFLLDELLSGTNSHDRREGAAAIVKALIDRGAIGCITTHDLALAEIERDLAGKAGNGHFEDQLIDGRMSFDYKLRPGIVTHSNALELMRAVGLPV